MKTTIGGDRLGSGSKSEISARNYERSTHDLSYIWRSSMSSGTLVPFMSELALPGDTWDIDLSCDVKTLPTVGPLFGSYKVQLDVFECPIRLYQGKLHMNMINIGMDMGSIKLPQYELVGEYDPSKIETLGDNMFVNPSSLYSYLNVRGLGRTASGSRGRVKRQFNAVPLLGYWEIYKNYYANLQEANKTSKKAEGVVIHQSDWSNEWEVFSSNIIDDSGTSHNFSPGSPSQNVDYGVNTNGTILMQWNNAGEIEGEVNLSTVLIEIGGTEYPINAVFSTVTQVVYTVPYTQNSIGAIITFSGWTGNVGILATEYLVGSSTAENTLLPGTGFPQLTRFPLENIDQMREEILQAVASPNAVVVDYNTPAPYGLGLNTLNGVPTDDWADAYAKAGQEGLAIKTYQSDLLNNWIDTEWIDGANGVGEVSAVIVKQNQAGTDDVVYMDSLNLQQKVYNMLNRIAVSGGTYDDWLDAVYTHERAKGVESPVYHGSLIKELAFEEVVSNSDTNLEINGQQQNAPLGTLAGRGKLTGKHKGGRIKIKTSEPSYLIGIVSITPRIDYSQGNKWDVNLKNMDNFYKPELGQIGYEDLVTGQMSWAGDVVDQNGNVEHESAGKQPAWINYMTNINQCRGNFAVQDNSMFMTLNRRYEMDANGIKDITTYIDPSKYNHIFAQTELDSQNFWVQIGNSITARRKMSAKTIPNL